MYLLTFNFAMAGKFKNIRNNGTENYLGLKQHVQCIYLDRVKPGFIGDGSEIFLVIRIAIPLEQ